MKTANPIGKSLVLGLITLGAVVIFAYYYVTAGGRLPFSGHLYTVYAQIQDPQGLLKHADVRAAGVKVGSVNDITNETVGLSTVAKAQMLLNDNFKPIYRDATVLIRQKTLVGENYIELDRGHPSTGALADGSTLPLTADQQSVSLDRILNALDPSVRRQIRVDLQTLGAGLHHEGRHLNQFLGGLAPTVHNGGVVFDVLQQQSREVADTVQQAGTLMNALAARTSQLQSLIRGASTTAQAVAARNAALQRIFVELPPTLRQARSSVATLSSFAGNATPVVSDLRVAMGNLLPVFRTLRPTAASARGLFAVLPPFLRAANPLLTSLQRFSTNATPAVPALDALLRQVNPVLDYIKPYYKDIGSFLMNFGTGNTLDATGDWVGRCLCPLSVQSYSGMTPTEQQLIQALFKAGALGGLVNPTYNGLRKPGMLPSVNYTFSGSYPHINAEPPHPLK
jgi:phospholipid/cholesterol/gamma-HCH transport system substrate-binding protein